MDPIDNIDLFESYLNGELTENDKAEFEARLQEDPDFEASFQLFKDGIQAIKNAGFRQDIRYVIEGHKRKNTASTGGYWFGGIAASILVLLAATFWQTQETRQDLFSVYYNHYPNVISTRGVEKNMKGMEAYSDRDFETAVALWQDMPSNDTIQFYLGLAFIETGQFESALESLKKVDSGSVFNQQKNWYLGLTFLKVRDLENARVTFLELQPGDYKFDESREIMEKL